VHYIAFEINLTSLILTCLFHIHNREVCDVLCVYSRIGAFERELSSTVDEILSELGHAPQTTCSIASSATPTPLAVP